MTDNGAAMLADETVTGLARLGIVHQTTLPYSPYQNAKQESFWGRVEGRLMAMLEGEQALTLDLLNQATHAWVEGEYLNRIALRLGAALALTTYGAQHGARYLLFAALAEFVSGVHAVAFFLVLA